MTKLVILKSRDTINLIMIKVSIIVPVYNTEKYLAKCLDSLINQILQDIEIVCVNDGSTDNSLDILNEYASKDSRIKIINQENKMQGAARNAGTTIATGEYIGFVDSDDWVDLDYYEKLYNCAKKYDSDIALATNVRVKKDSTKKRLNITEEKTYKTLQEKIDVCEQWRNECPTNKIYRLEMLRKNHIKWPEMMYCEDKLFTMKAIYYANGIVTVPDTYYYYYWNPKSTVNFSLKAHHSRFLRHKNIARQKVLNFLKEKKADIRDKDFWAISKDFKIFNIVMFRIKHSLHTEKGLVFGFIPVYQKEV